MRVKTFVTTPADIDRKWWLIDAEGQTLGRLASKIAILLRGKHKAIYTPNLDTGDYVVVVNCDKLAVTGDRMDSKIYYEFSGFFGGMKSERLKDKLERQSGRVMELAVKGMLPKGKLGRAMIKKLKAYGGAEHPHAGQNPEALK
ncbi:MAG: 50S ribosomal protein L13 [Anaerolineae bacterium]|nr:50S ribosomal protein L13 [Chloroflexota bacterium]MBP6297766.1 50S ribosomal protein L13 [Anaerolineae bacterium]